MQPYEILIAAYLFLFGACIGSFLNVVIYRLPTKSFLAQKRSHCPACGAVIRWHDLVPIAGWLILGGRCRTCKARISPRYPLVEFFCAALAPLCFVRFGYDWRTPLSFGAAVILLAIALIDADTMEIPDSLIIALIPFAAGAVWAWGDVPLLERGIGFVAVSVPLLVLALIINGAFGGGDIKLMAVCGFLLGWRNTLLAFMIALLLGGGYAAFLLISKRREKGSHIPFGPALCAGTAAAVFYGDELIRWYLRLYGL